MAGMRFKGLMGVAAAGSMLFSATAAVAQAAPEPQQISPWAALTVLSGGAPAVATMCGAAATAAAAQAPGAGCVLPAVDAPPPVAVAGPAPVPVEAPVAGYGFTPILLGLVAVAGALGFYLLVKNHNNKANSPT